MHLGPVSDLTGQTMTTWASPRSNQMFSFGAYRIFKTNAPNMTSVLSAFRSRRTKSALCACLLFSHLYSRFYLWSRCGVCAHCGPSPSCEHQVSVKVDCKRIFLLVKHREQHKTRARQGYVKREIPLKLFGYSICFYFFHLSKSISCRSGDYPL